MLMHAQVQPIRFTGWLDKHNYGLPLRDGAPLLGPFSMQFYTENIGWPIGSNEEIGFDSTLEPIKSRMCELSRILNE